MRDGDWEIFSVAADGTDIRQLTRNARRGGVESDDDWPMWSPNGREIVFRSSRDHEGDGDEDKELYVMEADGGDQRRLTENDAPEYPAGWSADGLRILFTRWDGRSSTIWSIAATGGHLRHVSGRLPIQPYVSFSPDGKQVAFAISRPGVLAGDVFVARADGRHRVRVTSSPGNDGAPVWSPDGKWIAFLSDRDRNGTCEFHDCVGHNPELYVVRPDGSSERRLTDTTAAEGVASWSPDGKRIVFSSDIARREQNYELYVVDVDGGEPRRLTHSPDWDWMPDWYGPPK